MPNPIIQIKNLKKIYASGDAETKALDGATFDIEKGEFVAIMGPSGSGKSTLLHLLGFLDNPTFGKYKFEGKDIESYTEDEKAMVRNERMGFVFQAFNLLPRTSVLENVKLPLFYSKIKESLWNDMAKKSIESVGLTHRLSHEPSQLSGGEKQRVAIARALSNNPEVILADEPTGNLDSKTGKEIMDLLKQLHKNDNKTIIMVTHDVSLTKYADRVMHIKDGKNVDLKEAKK